MKITAALLASLIMFLAAARGRENPAPQLPSDMTLYYLCLLSSGTNAGKGTKEEIAVGQAAHLANIERLVGAGKILVAGPFMGAGKYRGLFIYKCASLDEALQLSASDPLVQAGRLLADVQPWAVGKGYIRDAEFPSPPFAHQAGR